VHTYLEYLRVERQLSTHTLTNYQRHLQALIEWLQDKQVREWRELNNALVRQWAHTLRKHKETSPRTISTKMSALRSDPWFSGSEPCTWRCVAEAGSSVAKKSRC